MTTQSREFCESQALYHDDRKIMARNHKTIAQLRRNVLTNRTMRSMMSLRTGIVNSRDVRIMSLVELQCESPSTSFVEATGRLSVTTTILPSIRLLFVLAWFELPFYHQT